ncbi:MAG: hypothetical protein AB1938_02630 [Myxococcota bacterium]
MTAFRLSKLKPALKKLRPEYTRADRNGKRDGYLNQAEVRAQGQRIDDSGRTEKALVTVYNWAKSDYYDARVTPAIARAYLNEAAELIGSYDRNKDGFLTSSELKAARRNKTGAALIDYAEALASAPTTPR